MYIPPATSTPRGTLGSSSGGSAPGDASTQRPFVTLSLLEPPADRPAAGQLWPPYSPAEALQCLGPAGLSQLQMLDATGASGVAALAELIAAHCRQVL